MDIANFVLLLRGTTNRLKIGELSLTLKFSLNFEMRGKGRLIWKNRQVTGLTNLPKESLPSSRYLIKEALKAPQKWDRGYRKDGRKPVLLGTSSQEEKFNVEFRRKVLKEMAKQTIEIGPENEISHYCVGVW